MTKREASRIAHQVAYRFLQQAIAVVGAEAIRAGYSESDQEKIEAELDKLAQRHFELGTRD